MDILLLVGLILVAIGGIILAAFQLPGVWLILLTAVLYDWRSDWSRIGWKWLIALIVIAAVAELCDTLAGVVMAKRVGASRRAAIGSIIGGFAGMIMLSVPLPIIGTIVGGLIGCFAGALLGELSLHDDVMTGARVGLFATMGRLLGLMVKTAAAIVVAGAVVSLAVWN
jgi:uncharacterized protein YqgC (DUF456 family)